MCFAQPALPSLTEKHNKRRRVVFAVENDIIPILPPFSSQLEGHDPSHSWKSVLWYQPADLAEFREDARKLCLKFKSLQQSNSLLMPYDCSTRGLERRLSSERQRRKFISNRCIVHASKKLCSNNSWDADRLAALCKKINEWATELAVIEGARDFDQAWHDDRKRIYQVDQSRRVRPRISTNNF